MRQAKGKVPVSFTAVPRQGAWRGAPISLLLFLLASGSSALLAAEASPLDHPKPTASVAPPATINRAEALSPVKQKGQDQVVCAPSAGTATKSENTTTTPASPNAAVNENNSDASSPNPSDLTVKLPGHEDLEKDEIQLPADVQVGAGNGSGDKETFRVELKDKDKESEPANAAAGSPAQCSVPSTPQSGTGSPAPH